MSQESKSSLTSALVELARKGKLVDGTYQDGRGLMLKVEKGNGRWVLRLMVRGNRRDFGLGSVRHVSLAEAREDAGERIKAARTGRDHARVKPLPFKEAAKAAYELRKAGWKEGGKHIDQWWDSLEAYVFPRIGSTLVGDVTPGDMLDVLSPIWLAIP